MKTDKNSRTTTTSGTLPQPEQTVSDSNQREQYEVTLILTQRSSGSVIIEASSAEEARREAEKINEVFNWEIYEDEMTIESVKLASEGNSHD